MYVHRVECKYLKQSARILVVLQNNWFAMVLLNQVHNTSSSIEHTLLVISFLRVNTLVLSALVRLWPVICHYQNMFLLFLDPRQTSSTNPTVIIVVVIVLLVLVVIIVVIVVVVIFIIKRKKKQKYSFAA